MRAPQRSELVVALHAAADAGPALVGTKAATLGRLVQAGLAVPEGIALTSAAYHAMLADGDFGAQPAEQQLLTAPLPAEVSAAIDEIAASFGDTTLAVRSSAVDEDGTSASYAGQFETVLHVPAATGLADAVRRCWASAHSARARAYRGTRAGAPMAVLAQRQVPADVAGVAFTADPVTGDRARVLVSAVPGLGDTLTDGSRQPDEWSVCGGTASPVSVGHQALTETQAAAVAALALRVQDVLGTDPQDVEWAMADGRLVVLQARPITALPRAPRTELPQGAWVKETERHPEPLSELGASAVARFVGPGLSEMSREAGGLIERFEVRPIAGEPYLRVVPFGGHGGPPPPWWVLGLLARTAPGLRRQMRRAKRLLRPGVLQDRQRQWEDEWRPALQQRIAFLQRVELARLDDPQLVAHLDDVIDTVEHSLALHFRLTLPYLLPVHALIVACESLGWPAQRAIELVAGTSNATSAPARALAALGGELRRDPDAAALVDAAPGDLGDQLHELDPALGAQFDEWCTHYGQCCVNDDPGSPTLAELPATIARVLRDTRADVLAEALRASADTRAVRAAEARAALASRPPREREQFERVLADAMRAYPLREDSAFWTASLPAGLVRTAALEFGRRLRERGVLDRPEDAVQLGLSALRSSLVDARSDPAGVRDAIARARAERAYVRAHPGPAYYGPAPAPLPDVRGLPAAARRVNEALLFMQRRAREPTLPAANALLHGTPASAGSHTGPVRVISGPADFGRLQSGDVLVCPTTDPAWSVLFGIAGALVTDGGNVLSHAAIVAREHAIPAVVGTGAATRDLHDGHVVTVDGTNGVVTGGG